MRRRLYLQIYLGVVAVALAFTVVVWLAVRHLDLLGERGPRFLERAAEQIAEGVAEASPGLPLAGELQRHALRLGVHAAVYGVDGELVASTRGPRDRRRGPRGSLHGRGRRMPRIPGITLELEDGRWLRVTPRPGGPRGRSPLAASALLLVAIGAGAYGVSRGITRRLERLQRGVDRLGEGRLSERVEVEGNDEVADLARAFNRAADRIEQLVETRRRLLASASHELRTPLARLRVAVELLAEAPREDLRAEAERNVAELDELIEDLLLAARLEAAGPARTREVELLPLLREEAERFAARVEGEPVRLRGDPTALRRLLRNLLENAARHGAPPIDVELATTDEQVRIRVADAGPGVPESEREAIFEAFYRPAGHSESLHGGVGLGLALVREVARHHGGDARCLPRDGGGTLFEVTLRRS